ncbi:MAG: hypothetical protein PVI71_09105, partial [Desulfobacterales bacterium]
EKEISDTATRLLQDNDNREVAAGLRNIEAYTQLLKAMKPNPFRVLTLALFVVLIYLMIAGLLWYFRLPKIHVSFQVQSKAATFQLKKPWRPKKSYPVNKLRIERLNVVSAPALEIEIENESDEAWLEVDGSNLVLGKLDFGQNGFLELNPKRERLEIFYRGNSLKGEVAISGLSAVSAGHNLNRAENFQMNKNFQIPESIRFIAKSRGMVPTLIKIYPKGEWTFQDIYVQKLSFFRESIPEPGSIFFESAISGGSISIHDVSVNETLHEGDRLMIEGVEGRLLKIGHGSEINLVFEGTVEKLLLGPKGFEKNLSPSFLEYLYVRKPLAFFWGAVVFLWGVLWRVRKLIT